MPDIAALEKHACAACGAQAEWNPSKQLLVCPFCGTSTPFTLDKESGTLVENDLAKALRELPDEARGWLAEKRTVQCQSCKAVTVFDPERVGQNCEFCGSPALVDYKELKEPISPQSLLPFRVADTAVRERITSRSEPTPAEREAKTQDRSFHACSVTWGVGAGTAASPDSDRAGGGKISDSGTARPARMSVARRSRRSAAGNASTDAMRGSYGRR